MPAAGARTPSGGGAPEGTQDSHQDSPPSFLFSNFRLSRSAPASSAAAPAAPADGKKRAPNRLVVDDATNDDNSIISLSEKKASGWRHGGKGKEGRERDHS
jgi:hypothetical protein